MLLGRKQRTARGPAAEATLSLYYASDVHGSERCWRKFLGAGRFYGVQALVMGGDLTGKAIVPIETRDDGSFEALFIGETRSGKTAEQLEETMVEELRRWIALADERMAAHGIDVFVMPGNDDPWSCDAVIESAAHVQTCDDRVVRVGPHEMISSGYSNPTPWNTPRELDEGALYAR